ncbi:siphovirus Gp157 family protein [Lactobacillus acetotolerans]|uniref:siphovirus Gp157 family protein n=1 Tax=Lactobacillus acetotolerans TaxID=1600 RepID=UPI002FD8A0ED
MNLYQLEDNLLKVIDLAESADEDNQQLFNDTIDSIKDGIVDKAVDYAHVIKQLQADRKELAEKIAHDEAIKRSIDNNIKELKEALQDGMEMAGKEKIKGLDTSIWIQNNAPSLRHINDDLIPSGYIKQEPKIQSKEILKDLKNGVEIPGVELQQTKSIRIK